MTRVLWTVLALIVPVAANGATITIDFAGFPANLPPGDGLTTYAEDGYVFTPGDIYIYPVTEQSLPQYYLGTNAMDVAGDERVTIQQVSGEKFDLSTISLASLSPTETAPFDLTVQQTYNGDQSATETITQPGEFQSFSPNLVGVTSVTIFADDGTSNFQFTNLVVTQASSPPPGVPEPSALVLLGLGASLTMLRCQSVARRRWLAAMDSF